MKKQNGGNRPGNPVDKSLVIRTPDRNKELTRLTEKGLDLVRTMASEGAPIPMIARALNIGYGTFVSMRDRDEEVQEAFRLGRAEMTAELTGLLMKRAREGNIAANIFGLKVLSGFVEGQHMDGTRKETPQVNITIPPAMTDEAFAKMVDITPKKDEAE